MSLQYGKTRENVLESSAKFADPDCRYNLHFCPQFNVAYLSLPAVALRFMKDFCSLKLQSVQGLIFLIHTIATNLKNLMLLFNRNLFGLKKYSQYMS